jgi:hypothetical protein
VLPVFKPGFVQIDRKLRMASAASEHYAVGWSCGGSVGRPGFFCHDLPGGRLGHNCTSMWSVFYVVYVSHKRMIIIHSF